jgi:hypothetical protein
VRTWKIHSTRAPQLVGACDMALHQPYVVSMLQKALLDGAMALWLWPMSIPVLLQEATDLRTCQAQTPMMTVPTSCSSQGFRCIHSLPGSQRGSWGDVHRPRCRRRNSCVSHAGTTGACPFFKTRRGLRVGITRTRHTSISTSV